MGGALAFARREQARPKIAAESFQRRGERVWIGVLEKREASRSFFGVQPRVDEFNLLNETSVRLVDPHLVHQSRIVVLHHKEHSPVGIYGEAYPFPTSSMVACEAPGKALGRWVSFAYGERELAFPVPPEHQGLIDVALVVAGVRSREIKPVSDHFELEMRRRVRLVRNFPTEDRTDRAYRVDPKTKVPCGVSVSEGERSSLQRVKAGAFVGFLGIDRVSNFWDFPFLCSMLTPPYSNDGYGIVVEFSDADARKLNVLSESTRPNTGAVYV